MSIHYHKETTHHKNSIDYQRPHITKTLYITTKRSHITKGPYIITKRPHITKSQYIITKEIIHNKYSIDYHRDHT